MLFIFLCMQVIETGIQGLVILQPKVFKDARGYFLESYNQVSLKALGVDAEFVQDNQSMSNKGTIRGLHFQKPPHAQGKLVRVIKGAVLDVVVDIRKSSSTYGRTYSIELSEENFTQFYIPPGFAHGFEVLKDETIFVYKCTDVYHPELEGGLPWNDADLAIQWHTQTPILSDKDQKYSVFSTFESPF